MSRLTPPPDLRARLLAAAAKEPAPTGEWPKRVVIVTAIVTLWLAGLFLAVGRRGDWADAPGSMLVGSFIVLATSALALSIAGGSRGRSMLGAPASILSSLAALVPAALLAWVVLAPTVGPSTTLFSSAGEVVRHSGVCVALSFVLALPVLAALSWLRRDLTSGSRAVLGAASAVLAHVVVYAHCPIGNTSHTLFAHVLPMLPLMGLGAFVATRPPR
jgi:hypothetical protein